MKISIYSAGAICVICLLQAKADVVVDMAARSIPYGLRICELETDDARREGMVNVLARTVFIYWYQSRHLGEPKQKKIEDMMNLLYQVSLPSELNRKTATLDKVQPLLSVALDDPFGLSGSDDEPVELSPLGVALTHDRYQELLSDFRDYLQSLK